MSYLELAVDVLKTAINSWPFCSLIIALLFRKLIILYVSRIKILRESILQEDRNKPNAESIDALLNSNAEIIEAILKRDNEEQEEMKQEEFSEGRAEGKIEGRTEAKTEVARNLLLQGVSIDIIEKATGLSEKEITSLQKDSNSYRNNNNESKEQ